MGATRRRRCSGVDRASRRTAHPSPAAGHRICAVRGRGIALAVLSDLDGVLVDSARAVLRTWRRWARRQRLDPRLVEQTIHGRAIVDSVRLLAPESDVAEEVVLIAGWEIADTADLTPLPGARELQRCLGDERFAVVTSCNRPLAEVRLRAAGLDLPRILVTTEDVQRGKPNSEGYLLAAERLGRAPADCVVIEDAPVGLAAARAAGMKTVAVTTTFAREQLEADIVVASIAEVLEQLCAG